MPTFWRPMAQRSPKRMFMDYRLRPGARAVRVVLLSAVTLIIGAVLSAGEVTLAWDPNSEPDLAGYRLYHGLQTGQYDHIIDVGNVTTKTVTDLEAGLTYYFVVTAYNTAGLESDPSNEVSYTVPLETSPDARVVGRHIFYNQSAWDGNNAAANESDDSAIASDKQALLPGQTATFANYTSYSRGINGIMIDIAGLAGAPTVDDFAFKVGNNNDPTTWAQASLPTSITVRKGAGIDGSDRITLIWPNWPDPGSIAKKWLQVTVQATLTTDLAHSDVFYFGNAIGETGDFPTSAQVTFLDRELVYANRNTAIRPAPITSPYDFARDRVVSIIDCEIVTLNLTSPFTRLLLINAPQFGVGLASARNARDSDASTAPAVGDATDRCSETGSLGEGSDRGPTVVLDQHAILIGRRTASGQPCRLQSAPMITGPWQDVPGSDRTANASGIVEMEIPTQRGVPQQFFRWIEVKSGLGSIR